MELFLTSDPAHQRCHSVNVVLHPVTLNKKTLIRNESLEPPRTTRTTPRNTRTSPRTTRITSRTIRTKHINSPPRGAGYLGGSDGPGGGSGGPGGGSTASSTTAFSTTA